VRCLAPPGDTTQPSVGFQAYRRAATESPTFPVGAMCYAPCYTSPRVGEELGPLGDSAFSEGENVVLGATGRNIEAMRRGPGAAVKSIPTASRTSGRYSSAACTAPMSALSHSTCSGTWMSVCSPTICATSPTSVGSPPCWTL